MQLQQTQRHNVKHNWSKIAVIDTENASASLYSDLGNFNVLNLSAPHTPLQEVRFRR